ncbi:MAG: sensor histidine kinase [Solirubrobacteraceae bacterium]
MRRVPVRARVTAAFAVALAIVLVGIGLFLYLRFRSGFDSALDQGLRSRAGDVTALVTQADTGLAQGGGNTLTAKGEAFAQVLTPNGAIFDSTPLIRSVAILTRPEIKKALTGSVFIQRGPIGRINEPSRLFATPVHAQGQRLVVVVGVSLGERTNALGRLGGLLIPGGLAALLLVSVAGYAAVAAALRPIEMMRRRAAEISASDPGRRLPVPPAADEVSRLGTTLNAMLIRLEEAFARESRFVSDASHELRTPLGIVKTELELALRGSYSRDELEEAIRSAAEENERVIQLAEDLLVIARADQGRLAVRPVELDLTEELARVAKRFERRAAEEGRSLIVEVPAGGRVPADSQRLEQALANLIDNALRYGSGPVTLAAVETPNVVELHVLDAGPGFADSFVADAFERFTRADHARTRGGAGLGLSIVRAIAVSHGGEAHAANRDTGGADVWITLPKHREGPGSPSVH